MMTIDHYLRRGATVAIVTTKRRSTPRNLSSGRKGGGEAPEEGKPATRRWRPPASCLQTAIRIQGSHVDFPPMRGIPGGQDYSCTSSWLGRERARSMTPKSQSTPLAIPYPPSPPQWDQAMTPYRGREREREQPGREGGKRLSEQRRGSCWRDL